MTVENTQNKMPPLQMGTATEYPFTFAVLLQDPTEEEALKAIKANVLQSDGTEIELVYGVDYTVNLNTDRIGGTLFVKDVRTSGDYLTIYREYTHTQEVDYQDLNAAPAETFEQCFDKLTMLSQQQQEAINRSLKLNISSTTVSPTLPEPIANNTLIWDSEGASLKNYDVISENNAFKEQVNENFAAEKENIQNQFDDLEQAQEAAFEQFKTEVNTDVADVREAADKINALDESIAQCVNAAESARQNAQDCQEVLEEINQIDFNSKADIDLSNLSEEGKKKIGGGGLPLGYIGQTTIPIDESLGLQRYANGSQMTINKNTEPFVALIEKWAKLYPNMVTSTQEEWETIKTLSHFGQCGKYFINREQGYIQLPLVVNTQGLTDLSNFSNIVEAELPNITSSDNSFYGTRTSSANKENDAFYYIAKSTGTGYSGATQNNANLSTLSFDASRSNSIYKNGATVQQEQIQYPYFIQVATGASESIDTTRATEIITPYFLGMSQYFEVAPNNPSWVKSQGQYNSKAVYPDYYDWLLKIYNGTETQEGVSVKLATESYTDYDFVINQADETFRFPLLNGSEAIVSDKVKDFGNPASNTNHIAPANGWFNMHRTATGTSQYVYLGTNKITKQSESVANGANLRVDIEVKRGDSVYVSYNAPTAGYFRFIYAKGNGDLYYYVGEGIVNPQLVNVARIEEVKANKTDVDGQWVGIEPTILTTITSGSVTLDLSDILPSDNYAYELLLFDLIGGISAGQIRVQLSSSLIPRSSETNESFTITRGDNTGTGDGTAIFLVGADKTLTLTLLGMGASGTPGAGHALILCGYRRLGANI